MFTESAELYDLIYSRLKDYAREARDIAALLRKVHPPCHTILDVACGTGEHAHLLAAEHGFQVDGLDLDPAFVRIAGAKHPAGHFQQGDMVDLHLEQRYDAILCLFSSIGYVRTLANVRRALTGFHQHLAPEGVVLVEPWFPPGTLEPGHVQRLTIDAEDCQIIRVSHTEIDGQVSRIRFDYEIRTRDGVRRASEVHELGLFTTDEMLCCFGEAGLKAEHDPSGLMGRGLFVARAAAGRTNPSPT